MTNEWDGLTHDYTRKRGVVHSEIILPSHAPPEFQDRNTLWNSVEMVEKARDAQLAREIEISLPVELNREEQLRLARSFIRDTFVAAGMCADFSIHDKKDGTPPLPCHAHYQAAKGGRAVGSKMPEGLRTGRKRPANPQRQRRLEEPPGGHH